jgi:hypothetical protein
MRSVPAHHEELRTATERAVARERDLPVPDLPGGVALRGRVDGGNHGRDAEHDGADEQTVHGGASATPPFVVEFRVACSGPAASVFPVSGLSWRVAVALGVLLLGALVAGGVALTQIGSGHGSAVGTSSLTVGVVAPPKPPRGALVLAGESGERAVALAVLPRRLTATVLGGDGSPLSGLWLSFRAGSRVVRARPCGHGCYTPAARVEVRPAGSPSLTFRVPAARRPAAAIVARSARTVRSLRSLVYVESLRSGPTGGIVTTWRMKAPDEAEYTIHGGAEAVVLGERRWDRDHAGEPWRRSQQLPPLLLPQPAWGSVATNEYVLSQSRVGGRPVWVVSFANPTTPAWFTAWIDRETYRPLRLRMTAAAHFMFHRYVQFNRPLRIVPPR